MLTRRSTFYSLYVLFWVRLLVGCQPAATLEPNAVPANLRLKAQPDSVIGSPEPVNFSIATPSGQGPPGALIRWNQVNALAGGRSEFTAYTYDEQGRLMGTYQRNLDGNESRLVGRYQGGYLAQAYSLGRPTNALTNTPPDDIYAYQYNEQKKLSQVVMYRQPLGKGAFKLFQQLQYEYDDAGQLRLTRSTFNRAFDKGHYPTILRYWDNGDCIRTEIYEPNASPLVSSERLYYNQQVDPTYGLSLIALDQPSQHYLIGSGPSASGPSPQRNHYEYTYDTRGRVSTLRMRSLVDANPPSGWIIFGQYTYAP